MMGLPLVKKAVGRLLKDMRTSVGGTDFPILFQSLKHPSPAVRSNAAWTLARTGAPEAYAPLVELLDDPEPEVVRWAITSLGELEDPRAVAPLVRCLARSPSPWLQSRVEDAISRIGPARCLPGLLDLLEGDQTREQALNCLVRFKDQALELLLRRYTASSGPTRQRTLDLLIRIGEPGATTLLRELKQGQSTSKREFAEAALKTLDQAYRSWREIRVERARELEEESRWDQAATIYRELDMQADLRRLEGSQAPPSRRPHGEGPRLESA